MHNSDDYSSMDVLWEYLGIITSGALARQILLGRDAAWLKTGSKLDDAFSNMLQICFKYARE
jgi:hypothetical protein